MHRTWWRTFEIVLDGSRLVQPAALAKPLELGRGDIARVVDAPDGWLVVEAQGERRMNVPKYLEGFAELRSVLERWVQERGGRRTSG